MSHASLVLAIAVPKHPAPVYFLMLALMFIVFGLLALYGAHTAVKSAALDAQQHLSPAQQRFRDKFRVDPRNTRIKAVICFLIAACLIGFYFFISSA